MVVATPLPGEYLIKVTHKGKLYQLEPVDPLANGPQDAFVLNSGKEQAVSLVVSGNATGGIKRPELELIEDSMTYFPTDIMTSFRIRGFVGLRYQLQSSPDLQTWTDVDAPFDLVQPVDVKTIFHPLEESYYFRVKEVSPINN